MEKVYITRKIPGKAIEMLKERFDVGVNAEDRVLTDAELKAKVKGVDAILCLLTDKIDKEVMNSAGEQLKIIANYAVGFDNIDVEETKKRGIYVTNTPGVLTETVADFAFALLLAVARRIVEADQFTRSGKYRGWEPGLLLGQDVCGKTLGIVGLGRIGEAVARRGALGFNMKVIYYDRGKPNEELNQKTGAKPVSLYQVYQESDFISLHVPLTPETKQMISTKELSMMKKTAILINTSRGPVVDEKALVEALRDGKIAGAGLDVYENEPAIDKELLALSNVVLAPHIASASHKTREKMAEMAAVNIIEALAGKTPPNVV